MYNSVLVTKLINGVMLDGKKGVAQKVVYDAFDIIKDKTGKEPLDAFTEAMNNIMPALEVKARRVGGATYQVPIEVRPARRQTLALRWLVEYSRKRSEKTMKERLAGEIMDASRSARICTRTQKPTRLSHISDGNPFRRVSCPDSIHLRKREISVSWLTLTPERLRRLSVFFSTPA